MELDVQRVDHFSIDGFGSHDTWSALEWHVLRCIEEPTDTRSRFKIAWSSEALYLLFDCLDQRLSCTDLRDFDDLYEEDVVECFLWPDESQTLYFEYEASPLGAELPILVASKQGNFMGWRPWHYEGERRCSLRCSVDGGEQAPGAPVTSWRAEIRLPFALLQGLVANAPVAGDRWRANFYRIDYDNATPQHWNWSAVNFKAHGFHDLEHFGTIVFR